MRNFTTYMGLNMDVQKFRRGAYLEFPSLKQTHLSVYAGLNTARMSRGVNGETEFNKNEERTLQEVVLAIRAVQESVPYPVDWSQVGTLKPIIDQKRQHIRNSDNPVVSPIWVLRIPGGFFLNINNGVVVTTESETKCAAFENADVAEAVEYQLQRLGVKCYMERLYGFRRKNSLSHNLIEVGFSEEIRA